MSALFNFQVRKVRAKEAKIFLNLLLKKNVLNGEIHLTVGE